MKCSQDTATRDLRDLVGQGILLKDAAGGRSTSYSLKPESPDTCLDLIVGQPLTPYVHKETTSAK